MASEEEVDITIRTFGDTSGAKQVSDSLREIQQNAQGIQNGPQGFPTSQRVLDASRAAEEFRAKIQAAGGLEAYLTGGGAETTRAYQPSQAFATLMNARTGGLEENEADVQARLYQAHAQQQRQFDQLIQERARTANRGGDVVTDMMPADAVEKFNAAREALDATGKTAQQTGGMFNLSTMNVIRFAGALAGVGIGFSIFRAAGTELHALLQTILDDTVKLDVAQRDNTITLGQSAQSFQAWAQVVGRQAGVTQEALLSAGTAAQVFNQRVGVGPEGVQNMTALAVVLGRIHDMNVDQAMNQLTSAMNGNATAAANLGLQLDSAYVAYTQLGGATSDVFDLLDPTTQAFLRYQAALQQTEAQTRNMSDSTAQLQKAQGDLSTQWENLVSNVGPGLQQFFASVMEGMANLGRGFNLVVTLANQLASSSADWAAFFREGILSLLGPIGDLMRGFQALADTPAQLHNIGEFFSNLGTQVQNFAQMSVQAITAFGEATVSIFSGIAQTVLGAVQGMVGGIGDLFSGVLQMAQGVLSGVGGILAQINDWIKQLTGVDLIQGISNAIDGIKSKISDVISGIGDIAGNIASTLGGVISNIGQLAANALAEIQKWLSGIGSAIQQAGQSVDGLSPRLQALLSALRGPLAELAAARAEEIDAAQKLVDLKYEAVQLGATEAKVRLDMLPAQERMLELQNSVNQAQIEALQRALPATQEVQKLQAQITYLQDIARDPTQSIRDRQQAQVQGAQLSLQLQRAKEAQDLAQIQAQPAEFAAQTVQYQAQLQGLQQTAALFPEEYRQKQLTLLEQIADAARQAAARTVQLAVDAINVIVNNAGPITPEDEAQIAKIAGQAIAAIIHTAVIQAGARPAPNTLAGATNWRL